MRERGHRTTPSPKPKATPWTLLRNTLAGAGKARSGVAGLILLAAAFALVRMGERGESGAGGRAAAGETGADFRLLVNGMPLRSFSARGGDTVELILAAPKPLRYAILYRKDGGALAVHAPPESRGPAGAPAGERLPGRLVLGSGWERLTIYGVSAVRTFTLAEAESAVEGWDSGEGDPRSEGLQVQATLVERVHP